MDLLNGELDSSNETSVTSALDGNEVIGIEGERVSDISEVVDQETTTIPAIKMEPNVQMASASLSHKRRTDVGSETSVIAYEPRSVNDLPDEILLKILSHFGPEDLCLIIAKVCEKWNALAKDKILWKTLSYICSDYSESSRIAEVLTWAPALHSLIVRNRSDVADILEFLNHIHGDLRELILNNCHFGKDSTGLLANIVASYQDLEVLSLEGCRPLTSAGYCLIPHLKKLTELNLSGCQEVSGETIRLFADRCRHLKKLNLYCQKLTVGDDDIIHVIKKLGKQLTALVLDGQSLTDVAYSYLKNCARLQELWVASCDKMTDRVLLEVIGSLQELTHLRLNGGHSLTAQALSRFLHQTSMTSIVLLNLSDCLNLDDEGLKGIAERCIHLKGLAVHSCRNVTDAGISMVISHCSQLRILNVSRLTSITGVEWLPLVPSHLPHLRRLRLVGCKNMREKCIRELRAAVPELEIMR